MRVYRISAVTFIVESMERSCKFYSKIPGFRLVYGGASTSPFTTFQIDGTNGIERDNSYNDNGYANCKGYLNLELERGRGINSRIRDARDFGRIVFYTDDVDDLYSYLKNDDSISDIISLENTPKNAPWGERFFHVRDPDGYQLSFAKLL